MATTNRLDRLLSQLNTSGLQQKDNPLYQVIAELIKQVKRVDSETIGSSSTSITNLTEISQFIDLSGSGGDGDGEIGPPGPRGADGAAGINGSTGAAGPLTLGPMGLNGEDGEDGFPIPGNQGIQGVQGIQGIQGVAGPLTLGPMGMDGEDGEDGFPIPGPIGATGATGTGGITTLRTTGNQTINAGGSVFTDITDLTFPVVNGVRYAFKFYIVFQSALLTTGWRSGVNCPTGTLDFFTTYQTIANSTTGSASWVHRHNTVRDDMLLLSSTVTANVDLVVVIEGRYLCTADGTFAARFANELGANTDITIREGSWGMYF